MKPRQQNNGSRLAGWREKFRRWMKAIEEAQKQNPGCRS